MTIGCAPVYSTHVATRQSQHEVVIPISRSTSMSSRQKRGAGYSHVLKTEQLGHQAHLQYREPEYSYMLPGVHALFLHQQRLIIQFSAGFVSSRSTTLVMPVVASRTAPLPTRGFWLYILLFLFSSWLLRVMPWSRY